MQVMTADLARGLSSICNCNPAGPTTMPRFPRFQFSRRSGRQATRPPVLRQGAARLDARGPGAAGRGEIDLPVARHPIPVAPAEDGLDHHAALTIGAQDVEGAVLGGLGDVEIDRAARRNQPEILLDPMAEHQPAMQRRGTGIGEAEAGAHGRRPRADRRRGRTPAESSENQQRQEATGHLGSLSRKLERRQGRPAAQQIARPLGDGDDRGIHRAGGDAGHDRGIADMRARRSRGAGDPGRRRRRHPSPCGRCRRDDDG